MLFMGEHKGRGVRKLILSPLQNSTRVRIEDRNEWKFRCTNFCIYFNACNLTKISSNVLKRSVQTCFPSLATYRPKTALSISRPLPAVQYQSVDCRHRPDSNSYSSFYRNDTVAPMFTGPPPFLLSSKSRQLFRRSSQHAVDNRFEAFCYLSWSGSKHPFVPEVGVKGVHVPIFGQLRASYFVSDPGEVHVGGDVCGTGLHADAISPAYLQFWRFLGRRRTMHVRAKLQSVHLSATLFPFPGNEQLLFCGGVLRSFGRSR